MTTLFFTFSTFFSDDHSWLLAIADNKLKYLGNQLITLLIFYDPKQV